MSQGWDSGRAVLRLAARLSALALVAAAASCASSGGRGGGATGPAPVQRLQPGLPADRYLSAAGYGDTRAQAEKAAASELAKIFESRIKVEDVLVQRYAELIGGKDAGLTARTDGSRETTITSAQTLYNLKYTEPAVDSKGLVTVVAYMDRRETAAVYQDRIGANSRRVKFLIAEEGRTDDQVRKYAFAGAAAAIGANNRALVEQLAIISMAARQSVELGYDQDALQKRAADAAKNVGFSIRMGGDPDGKVRKMCEELITDMGFVVSDSPALTLEGAMAMEDTDLGRTDMKFVRYDFSLRARDRSGACVATVVQGGREGHASAREASARVLRTVRERLQTELRRRLTAYFDGFAKVSDQ